MQKQWPLSQNGRLRRSRKRAEQGFLKLNVDGSLIKKKNDGELGTYYLG